MASRPGQVPRTRLLERFLGLSGVSEGLEPERQLAFEQHRRTLPA